jgi:TonB family protein
MVNFAISFLVMAQAVPTASIGDWQWDTNAPICTLRQELPASEALEISRTPANEETQLKVTIPARPGVREGQFHDVAIDVPPAGKSLGDGTITKDGKKLRIYAVTADPSFIQNFASASVLAVPSGTSEPAHIGVRSARAAVQALRECEDRKMQAWGIDSAAWRSLKSRPIPLAPVRDRFSALDYPPDALRAGIEFDAIIRLDVAADGRVQECRGLNPGSYKGFEAASCEVLKGAHFRPALDASGNPVSAPILFDVVFRIDN